MFNIDFSSKRAKLALRFFTYGVMTISTVVITTIMIFFALGYRLDKDFNFAQGGLVQFKTFPESADVYIDGQKQSSRTPSKANLFAGQHTVSMSLQGYHEWTKTFDLAGSELLWLNYARLIPEDVKTSVARDFSNVSSNLSSPDKHWVLLQTESKSPVFVLADISDEKQPKFTDIQIPDSSLTKKNDSYGTFTVVEWDLKSQNILFKHQNADVIEFISLDRSKPNEAVNLTKVFGFNITEAHYSGNSSNIIFANTSGVLRRLDVSSKSASGVLVNKLSSFVVYGDEKIAYVATDDSIAGNEPGQILGVWNKNQPTVVRKYLLDDKIVFNYSEYDGHDYLAVGVQGSNDVNIIRDPADNAEADSAVFAQFSLGMSPKWISFSSNGRMLVAQNNCAFATYDLEESRSYSKTLDIGAEVNAQYRWLDDFYLYTTAGELLHVFEFDGTNLNEVVQVVAGQSVTLSSGGKSLFSIGRGDANGFSFQRSDMTVSN
jgi:hypothetical protein